MLRDRLGFCLPAALPLGAGRRLPLKEGVMRMCWRLFRLRRQTSTQTFRCSFFAKSEIELPTNL